jgi:chromodomain-helicase-DNA-binding protein 1
VGCSKPVSYEGMDVGSLAHTRPPRRPRLTASHKAMEFKEQDVRVLVQSLQRWGDIRQ